MAAWSGSGTRRTWPDFVEDSTPALIARSTVSARAQTSAGDVLAVAPRATSPGDVDITVTTPGGTSSKTTPDRFTFVAATSCKVPKLLGKSLTAARKLIKRAHCATGKIKHRGRHVHKPVVVAQSPKGGAKRASGTKVTLTLGVKKKR